MNLRRNIHSGIAMVIVSVCGLGASYMIFQASQIEEFYPQTAQVDWYAAEETE